MAPADQDDLPRLAAAHRADTISGSAPPSTELGEFLRSRRDRLTPDVVGLRSYGRRRVPGLRREELAQLAGVSATYLTRLEQGQSSNASDAVIDALARALRLDPHERDHLFALARPTPRRRARSARPETAKPGAVQLLNAVRDVPAILLGRHLDFLAWNRPGHRLLAGHLDVAAPSRSADRPNHIRMLFLDPHTIELYRDWSAEAALAVASLRYVAGLFPSDRRISDLVGELSVRSTEFAGLWAGHTVRLCTSGSKVFQHPELGTFALDYEVLHLPEGDGQRILMYTAAPDSPAESALRLLTATAAD